MRTLRYRRRAAHPVAVVLPYHRLRRATARESRRQIQKDWSETTVTAQRNWLGRSEGAKIDFAVGKAALRVFTTRPDTLFGATFMVIAPEHPLVDALATPSNAAAVDAYRATVAAKDLVSRKVGDRDKTGVFTGGYAVNPATNQPIPVWIADYVLMEYGTGAIMAVPAHDERDFDFARRFGLPVVQVVAEQGVALADPLETAYADGETGVLVNSGEFDNLAVSDAKYAITRWLEQRKLGKGVVQFRLHDWCISRQRYWGPPIPVIYCDEHGAVPVPERDLPVVLPRIENFRPDDTGVSPLARHEEWYYAPCPQCGKQSRRETDVSDTFLDSAWYYLRYPSADFDDRPFDLERTADRCRSRPTSAATSTPSYICFTLAISPWCSTASVSSTSRSRSGSSARTA